MTKFTLSKPQRMLFGLAIFLFIVSLVWMTYFIVKDVARELSRGIKISYASTAPNDSVGPQTQTLAYDETITQSSGESILQWNNNKLYLFGPAQVTISPDKVDLQSGFAYLEAPNSLTLSLNSQPLIIESLTGLYDATISGFTVMSGSMQVNDNETAQANHTILFDGAKFTTASFDREQLQTDKWKRIITLISSKSQLPTALADLVPPALTDINPPQNFATTDASINISGKTEPAASVKINQETINADSQGNFLYTLDLATGRNDVLIIVTDAAGNTATANLVYTRNTAAAASTCSQTTFASKLLCLINTYRTQNKLPALTLNSQLTTAAQAHSEWMDANQELTHNRPDGSTPITRCNDAGTTCDAQSIAQLPIPTAEAALAYWQSQAQDNPQLLGTHTEMGAAVEGEYITLVLH